MGRANDRVFSGHEGNVGAAKNSASNSTPSNNKLYGIFNTFAQAGSNSHQSKASTQNGGLLIFNSAAVKQENNQIEIKSEFPDKSPIKVKLEKLGMYSPTGNHPVNTFGPPPQSSSIKSENKMDFLNLFSRSATNVQKALFGKPRKPIRRRRRGINGNAILKCAQNQHNAAENCTLVSGTIGQRSPDLYSPVKKLIQTKITFFVKSPAKPGSFQSPAKVILDDHSYSKPQWTDNTRPWYEYSDGQLKETSTKQANTKRSSSNKRSHRSTGGSSTSKRRKLNNSVEVDYLKKYAHLNLKNCSIVLDRIDVPTYSIHKASSIGMSWEQITIIAFDKAINEPRFQPFVLLTGKCF